MRRSSCGADEGSRNWPRAQPAARPARRSRPAPSAPAGALTPILLRKHLLGFKLLDCPSAMGKTNYSTTAARFRLAGGKSIPKAEGLILEETPPAGEALPARTAPQPSAPHSGTPTSWPVFSVRDRAQQPLSLCGMPTTTINNNTTTDNYNSNNNNSNRSGNNSNSNTKKNKGFRGTGDEEGQEDRGAGAVPHIAEYRRPARGELSAYQFAALPACGEAREGRCNPICTRVAIRVPEEIAAAGASSGGRRARRCRRCGGGRGSPRIPPWARERRRRGAGEVSVQRRRDRPRVWGSGAQT